MGAGLCRRVFPEDLKACLSITGEACSHESLYSARPHPTRPIPWHARHWEKHDRRSSRTLATPRDSRTAQVRSWSHLLHESLWLHLRASLHAFPASHAFQHLCILLSVSKDCMARRKDNPTCCCTAHSYNLHGSKHHIWSLIKASRLLAPSLSSGLYAP